MSTVAQPDVARTSAGATQTRIASYLLAEYLERLGVDVIFGLCGHTNIAFLDAIGKSRIRFVACRHEADAALADRVEEGDVGVAAEPEDHVDAEAFQVFGEQVRSDARLRGACRGACDVRLCHCAHLLTPASSRIALL